MEEFVKKLLKNHSKWMKSPNFGWTCTNMNENVYHHHPYVASSLQ